MPNSEVCTCSAVQCDPASCRCTCRGCRRSKALHVPLSMTYGEKHDELSELGWFYRLFFVDGLLAKVSEGGSVAMHGTRDLYQDRSRRLVESLSTAERELMSLTSRQVNRKPPKANA